MRKNPEEQAKDPKNIPQGLKPVASFHAFTARLKSCPFKKWAIPEFFRSMQSPSFIFSGLWQGEKTLAILFRIIVAISVAPTGL